MTKEELFTYVDHTALKACTSKEDIIKLCKEAIKYKTASVCIPSSYVSFAKANFPELNICTVVGFPLGYANTASKIAETKQAIEDGAGEIDMVINLTWVKNREFDAVLEEIRLLKEACGQKILKVIIETCYLTDEEKIKLCQIVTEARADYIKTSTGFGTAGANLGDVTLMRKYSGKDVKVKAAGGVKSKEDMEAFIKAGADRIGTSSAISMLAE